MLSVLRSLPVAEVKVLRYVQLLNEGVKSCTQKYAIFVNSTFLARW